MVIVPLAEMFVNAPVESGKGVGTENDTKTLSSTIFKEQAVSRELSLQAEAVLSLLP